MQGARERDPKTGIPTGCPCFSRWEDRRETIMSETNLQADHAANLCFVAGQIERGQLTPETIRVIDRKILHGPTRPDGTRPPGWLSVRFSELVRTAGEDGFLERASIRAALHVLGKLVRDKHLPEDPAAWIRTAETLRAAVPTREESKAVQPASKKRSTGKVRATINARIIDLLQQHPEASGWSARKIAAHLKCGKSTVAATNTYLVLEVERTKARAERATAQRRNRNRLPHKQKPDKTG